WYKVVDLNSKAFRPQKEGNLTFCDMISTDSVGLLITDINRDTSKSKQGAYPYSTSLSRADHEEILGRCVAVDPGRRDLMYCVHEKSTNIVPRQFRYTQS
ncbi:hypothetical protein BX666DRAFT_1846187, partial [Dichotomocladium elegans]